MAITSSVFWSAALSVIFRLTNSANPLYSPLPDGGFGSAGP